MTEVDPDTAADILTFDKWSVYAALGAIVQDDPRRPVDAQEG